MIFWKCCKKEFDREVLKSQNQEKLESLGLEYGRAEARWTTRP